MKKAVLAACVATMLSVSAQADTLLGLYIGGSVWDTETSGSFGDKNAHNDFSFKDEKNNNFFVALEHPIPFLPNVKIVNTELATDGYSQLTADFTFDDVDFTAGTEVNTDFDISFIDYTFYYELFDNDLLTFDVGITARDFDGDIMVMTLDNSVTSTLGVTDVVPMLYVNTIIGLPFTGLNIFAEGNFLSFDDQDIYDYQAGISYALLDNLAVDLDVMVGYRAANMELDDMDGLYSNLDFKGLFVGAVVHF